MSSDSPSRVSPPGFPMMGAVDPGDATAAPDAVHVRRASARVPLPEPVVLPEPVAVPEPVVLPEPAVLPAPNRDPYIGLELEGRYRLTELIARSGMSRVYRGVQPTLSRQVAVKLLIPREGSADITELQRRFEREAAALARLSHPNTVRVYDHGSIGDMQFLVMEYIEGITLRNHFRDHTPSPNLAIDVIDQLSRALVEAHEQGIIHRDLKPANVFLAGAETADLVVRLVDFGIAKDAEDAEDITGIDTVLGTPWYMAPEQAMGESVDGRTDIYALGILLYRMLMGRTPYGDIRGASVLVAHINKPAPTFSTLKPDHGLPEVVEWTVMRCLEKHPNNRFRDVGELRKALQVCRLALSRPDLDVQLGLVNGVVEAPEDVAELLMGTQLLLTRRMAPVRRDSRPVVLPWLVAGGALAAAALLFWMRMGTPTPPVAPSAPVPPVTATVPVPVVPVAVPTAPASVQAPVVPEPPAVAEPPAVPAASAAPETVEPAAPKTPSAAPKTTPAAPKPVPAAAKPVPPAPQPVPAAPKPKPKPKPKPAPPTPTPAAPKPAPSEPSPWGTSAPPEPAPSPSTASPWGTAAPTP